ncbi:MAG: molecular chaperone DnaJ [Pseudomonadota bacterium]
MPRIILLLAIALILFILIQRVSRMPPHRRRGEYFKILLGALVVLTIMMTLAGKMHWVGAAVTGLLVALRQSLPLLLRLLPFLGSLKSGANAQAQQSTLQTSLLRMILDHETGELAGEVLAGPYEGWRLDDLTDEQLRELAEYCEEHDSESAQLLAGYLEQRFGANQYEQAEEPTQSNGELSRQEALSVLGLGEEADEEAIIDAHRKLMQKLHPDRGGSDYLAAKINQAKDFLLG